MNNLSWIIYLADVMPNLATTLIVISAIICLVCAVFQMLIHLSNQENINTTRKNYKELTKPRYGRDPELEGVSFEEYLKKEYVPEHFPKIWLILFVSMFVFIAGLLVPGKETFYLIAGSEAGEAVVNSEQGQEIVNDIQQVIKYQLKSLRGEP